MEASIFSLDLDRFSKLKTQEGTEVFGRLLWCEAARLGLVNIVVSGDVSSSDGGIDAKAEHVGGKGKHSFHYQIKTGTAFRPWQQAAITKELFGSSEAVPSKAKLGPAVRRCLNISGTYVMVSLGHDLLAENHSSAVSLLEAAFKMCGYKNPRVEVWGARQIANMMERYPSLCLDLGGLGDARFQTVASWAKNGDMTPRVSLGAPQRDFIQRMQALLTGSDFQHARVIGEPGIGKTRLVLEAIKEMPQLSAKAIYVPHAEYFQVSRLFFELLKDDREYSAVLVIDECDDDDRASIFNALRGRPRIKLVTIDHGPELTADALMEVIKFPPLEDPQIEEILREYIGKAAHAHNWISWCEGSARVAHAVGDNLKRNPEDILKSPAIVPIWDRFVLGYNKVKGEQAERLLTIARHIALFRKFGAKKPVQAEGRFVATLASRVDPNITPGAFEMAVAKLAGRRILQGTHTMRLVPRALHVHLWKQWWDIHGPSANLSALMDEMPETLRRWFLDMLIYSNGSPSAQAAIKEVLGVRDGPFTSNEFVASKSGSHFLNVMAEADPAATLEVLERTLGHWPRSDLEQLSEARQTLVFALEKIAVWEPHFPSAAKLLAHLCFGESAANSNNARGTLKGLFSLRGAPTQASAAGRLSFAQALLSDSDRFNRFLGLELCEKLLNDRSQSRIIGVEYQGLAPPIAFWYAKIWNDLFEPRRRALQLLLERSDPSDREWQGALSKVVVESADDMLHHHALTELALSTLRGQLDFAGGDGQALAKMLLHRVKHPYQGTSARVTEELQALLDATGTGTFAKRFDRFVTYDTYEENYNVDAAGEIVESDLPARRIEALAREFVGGEGVRLENFEQVIRSPGQRASEFGRRVAALSFGVVDLDDDIFDRAESLSGEVSIGFLSGYLETLRRLDCGRWESRALKLLADAAPSRWKTDSVVFSGFSPVVVARLLDLFAAKAVHASRFLPSGWKLGEEQLSASEVELICERLNQSGDAEAARAAIQIASYRFAKKGSGCSESLLWALLMNPKVFERHHDNMTSHYWKTLAKSFRKRLPEQDIKLLEGVFENHCRSGGSDTFSGIFEMIMEICKLRPKESWSVVASALENSEVSWTISYWLGERQRLGAGSTDGGRASTPIDCFEPQQVLDWIKEKPSRADLIMQSLPKSLEQGRAGELTRGFIEFFGPKSIQGRQLMGHFDTGMRSGPDSVYYSARRDAARSWMGSSASPQVREWIGDFISMLSRFIEEARIREERNF